MKKFLEDYFYKKNFFIFTPKIHSFGGFFESFLWGVKLKNFTNKKLILAIPFFDYFKHYKRSAKKFDYHLIFNLFLSLSFIEKLYSIIFTFWLNLNLLLIKIKLRGLLIKLFGFKNHESILFYRIGFSDDINNYNINNINLVYKQKISKKILSTDTIEEIKNINKKIISFCVKDNNYDKVKKITSTASAEINNYKIAIKFLIENDFYVVRIGEPLMKEFIYNDPNYLDLTKSKEFYDFSKKILINSEFYFGTSGSHSICAELFDLKKIISNSRDFLYLNTSFSYDNWCIFKKVFDVELGRFMSLDEIYSNNYVLDSDIENQRKYIFVENDQNEILELTKAVISKSEISEKHKKNIIEFNRIRNKCLNKNFFEKRKPSRLYELAKTNILESHLDIFLYPNKELYELSDKFKKNYIDDK